MGFAPIAYLPDAMSSEYTFVAETSAAVEDFEDPFSEPEDHEEYCELFDDIMSDIMAEREDPVAGIQLTLPLMIGDFRI